MSIRFTYSSKNKTEDFLKKVQTGWAKSILEKYGQKGVALLSEATPRDTGKTAESWYYRVRKIPDGYAISWHNSSRSSEQGGIPIVALIRYGHVTRQGGYVAPNDFVAPIVDKLFKDLDAELWKEVRGL